MLLAIVTLFISGEPMSLSEMTLKTLELKVTASELGVTTSELNFTSTQLNLQSGFEKLQIRNLIKNISGNTFRHILKTFN